jgi:hypothetical protein
MGGGVPEAATVGRSLGVGEEWVTVGTNGTGVSLQPAENAAPETMRRRNWGRRREVAFIPILTDYIASSRLTASR